MGHAPGKPGARKLFAAVPTGRPSLVQGGGRPAYPLKGSWRGVRHGGLGPCNCRSHEDSARSDGTILPVGHPPPARPPPKPTVCLPQPRLGPLGKRRLRVGYSLGEYTWVPLLQRAAPLHAFSSPKALKHTLDQVPRGFGHQVRRRTPPPVPRAAIFCRTSCSATGGM